MSEWPALAARRGRRSPTQAIAAAARAFLLDPAEAEAPRPPSASARRPVVTVFGLARGCGSTVVSRAIAAELAARDPTGACVVACDANGSGLPLATPAATRLARTLEDLPGGARALGRLCLVRGADPSSLADALPGLAPLVIDAGSSTLGGAPAAVADHTLVVTTPAVEEALARVATECVARVGPVPIVVMNRAGPGGALADGIGSRDGAGSRDGSLRLPETRVRAQLALSGRGARGAPGRAVAALVDSWERR